MSTGPKSAWNRRWAVFAGALLLSAGAVAAGGWLWLQAYLHGDSLRGELEAAAEQALGVRGRFEPFVWSGATVECAGFEGRGQPGTRVSSLRAEGLRVTFSPAGLLRRTWDVREAEIQSLDILWDAGGPRQGALRDLSLTVSSDDLDWVIRGGKGRLLQPPFPPLTVAALRASLAGAEATVEELVLREPSGGRLRAQGTVRPREGHPYLEAAAVFEGIPVAPLLAPDWQDRFSGAAAGRMVATGRVDQPENLTVTGQVELQDATIHSLPMWETIGRLTGQPSFEALPLHTAQAGFAMQATALHVQRIVAESEGRLRIEGDATVRNAWVEGRFRVGVSEQMLHWLPGARQHVFQTQANGYHWAPMQLNGAVAAPREDLTARLLEAVKSEFMEQPGRVVKRGLEAAGNWLQSLWE